MNYKPGQIIIPRHGVGGDGIIGIVRYEEHGKWFVVCTLERHTPLAGPFGNREEAMQEARRQMDTRRKAYPK